MRLEFPRTGFLAFLAATLTGCGTHPQAPSARADTGADAVARAFFEALVREDWTTAYDTLDADSRRWCGKELFVTRAKVYTRLIGFTPTAVNVSVSESGNEASAVAVFRAGPDAGPKHHSDGTALRRTPGGWVIALRKNFGVVSPTARTGRTGKP